MPRLSPQEQIEQKLKALRDAERDATDRRGKQRVHTLRWAIKDLAKTHGLPMPDFGPSNPDLVAKIATPAPAPAPAAAAAPTLSDRIQGLLDESAAVLPALLLMPESERKQLVLPLGNLDALVHLMARYSSEGVIEVP